MATAASNETETTLRNVAEILEDLGGIDPSRVLLKRSRGPATEADLIAVNERGDTLCELVDGLLVEKGLGYTESSLALILAGFLNAFIVPRNVGLLSGPDGGMRLFPGLVRLPDIGFASWDRIPGRRRPTEAIAGFVPDLAIEVLSRSNTKKEMARKRLEYFRAGVRLVWEVDPRARTVAVHEAPEPPTVLEIGQALDGGDVLPGFALPLADLFADLDRQGT